MNTADAPADFQDAWADVKAPGDGQVYSVGTVMVGRTGRLSPPDRFSSSPVSLPLGVIGISLPTNSPPNTSIQVAVLQISNADGSIVSQAYFYGSTPTATYLHLSTNARGISVLPGSTPDETRIAICGETYESSIPASQTVRVGTTFVADTSPGGFIAVFDGDLDLLWTHHFFGTDPEDNCAITDVSIRVEQTGPILEDVVTYCGISSIGVPSNQTPSVLPTRPFAAPSAPTPNGPCLAGAGGATDNGGGQWDGIVGRLRRLQSGGPATVRFHSVVGGRGQDGLFGIAEIDTVRFAVVGSSSVEPATPPGLEFPLTVAGKVINCQTGVFADTCLANVNRYCVGTLLVFRDDNAALILEHSQPIGSLGPRSTVARDVFVHRDIPASTPLSRIHVVGSTNDGEECTNPTPPNQIANFFRSLGMSGTGLPTGAFQERLNGDGTPGAADGFVVTFQDLIAGGILVQNASFLGGPMDDGLIGIAGWNEYPDHVALAGITEIPTSPTTAQDDITVASVFVDPAFGARPGAWQRVDRTG
ncbi:MAG: hypothetical protein IPK26_30280 [Planctomycetes bacterium]|nr:hypothetical protein [Planctomycetota bacterium]